MQQFAKGGITAKLSEQRGCIFDRAWWRCKKCKAIFESYLNPPNDHICSKGKVEGGNAPRNKTINIERVYNVQSTRQDKQSRLL